MEVVVPELVETSDFLNFRYHPEWSGCGNKGMAIFPRKIAAAMPCSLAGQREHLPDVLRQRHFWNERGVLLKQPFLE